MPQTVKNKREELGLKKILNIVDMTWYVRAAGIPESGGNYWEGLVPFGLETGVRDCK